MKRVRSYVKCLIDRFILYHLYKNEYRLFDGYYDKLCGNVINNSSQKSNKWYEKWKAFGYKPNPQSFSCYSSFIGPDDNIVPNEIARSFIEPILTPSQFQSFYNDKNSLSLILDKAYIPKTIIRSILNFYYDEDYNPLSAENVLTELAQYDRVVLKPSMDMGGNGVSLFTKRDGAFYNSKDEELTIKYLEKYYKTNFLIQECLEQEGFFAQFNPSSINTIRMATYKDVSTGEIVVLGAVLRIGGKGSFIDNACSGGRFVLIDDSGKLGNCVYSEHGESSAIYNGIDFEHNTFIVPNFSEIKNFACMVAKRFPHMRLLANDIMIDKNGCPKIIEVNTQYFSYWFYQITNKAVFGKYTDELIDYCKKEQANISLRINKRYF